jgi:hypothetical protein
VVGKEAFMIGKRIGFLILAVSAAAAFALGFIAGGAGGPPAAAAGPATENGDVNADGLIDISDPVFLLNYLFLSGEAPAPISPAPPQTLSAVIVRHCEKDDTVAGDAPLSEAGMVRAARLTEVLLRAKIDVFLATEYNGEHLRTVQTLQAAAEARGLEIRIVEAGEMAAALRALPEGTVAAVAGNNKTLPPIIGGLGVPDTISDDSAVYDNLYVVRFGPTEDVPGTMVQLRY